MSDDNGKTTETTTRTDTETREGREDVDGLTPEQEKVIRARHGLSEDGDHQLSFALGADEETEQALARLESFLVEAFGERSSGEHFFPSNRTEESADNEVKRKIIDALKDEQD